jgi:hypothetical protein
MVRVRVKVRVGRIERDYNALQVDNIRVIKNFSGKNGSHCNPNPNPNLNPDPKRVYG